jgi:hypothetical protein
MAARDSKQRFGVEFFFKNACPLKYLKIVNEITSKMNDFIFDVS